MASTKQYMVLTPGLTEQNSLKQILNTSLSERGDSTWAPLEKHNHGSSIVGNEGAQFGAGVQQDSVSCQNFHTLELNAGSPESTQGALVQPLKSDLKRERCGLMTFYLVQERKTANGFLEKRMCLLYPPALVYPSSSVWPGQERRGCARSQRSKAGAIF